MPSVFHAVVVPDSGAPTVERFDTIAALETFLNTNTARDADVVVGLGDPCLFGENPRRLETPMGTIFLEELPKVSGPLQAVGRLGRPRCEEPSITISTEMRDGSDDDDNQVGFPDEENDDTGFDDDELI